MLELRDYRKQPVDGFNQYEVSIFADSKEDLVDGAPIHNLPSSWVMQPGSQCITADGEVAFLKSDGKWNWVS